MKILIVEDEPLAQEELSRIILKHFPQVQIAVSFCSVKETVQWLNTNIADLIFMDVQLADGLCFDIFEHVTTYTPIIFITAYDQYAIQAFKVNSIGYLLKPINEEELQVAVNKLNYSPSRLYELLDYLKPARHFKNRIAIKSGDSFSFLPTEEIAYFYVEDGVTFIVSRQGKRHIVEYTIEALEPQLNPKDFFKITRGCIVSIHAIAKVNRHFNSRLKVSLIPEYNGELLISRVRVPDFIRWLDGE